MIHRLNCPVGLNPLQQHVLDEIPEGSKTGVVVGAGDGRLSAAIMSKLGKDARVFNVEPKLKLHKYLKQHGSIAPALSAWDLQWYSSLAEKNDGFDFIIFYNVHEYWNGQVDTLQSILQLLKPDGLCWMSFYNSTTLYEIGRHIPPLRTGYEKLANPMDIWPRMDISSWMIYCSDIGLHVDEVWGLMQKDAFTYCQQAKPTDVEWKVKDLSVRVRDIGDAFMLGAPIVCFKLSANVEGEEIPKTRFLGTEYSPSMLQAILFPFDNEVSQELNLFRASVEAYAQAHEGEDESNLFIDFFLSQLKDFESANKVLVVGSGWGADLLALKKLRPGWEITGIESNEGVLRQGLDLLKEAKITAKHFDAEGEFPFEDGEFDLVISLRHFSSIYPPLAKHLAKEMMRVSKQGVAQFEDIRGPEISMQLKSYNIPAVYQELGYEPQVIPLLMNEELSGMYVMMVKKA